MKVSLLKLTAWFGDAGRNASTFERGRAAAAAVMVKTVVGKQRTMLLLFPKVVCEATLAALS